MTACSCDATNSAVAATVNGTEILEQDVTEKIEAMRSQSGDYAEDVNWATALSQSGLTPESLRQSVIDSMARDIVVMQEAESQGFVTDDEAIDEQVSQTRITVGAEDDAAWLEMLQNYGYKDEQAYRDMLVINDLTMQLYNEFALDPSDEDLKAFIAQNPDLVEGFNLVEPTTPVAEEPEPTEGTEGDAAETEVPVEPATISPSDVDLTAIPANVLSQYKELWSQNNKGLAFQEWIQELVDKADIVVNPMPENVSYNVDMSLASTTPAEDETNNQPPMDYSSPEAVAEALSAGLQITDVTVGEGAEAVSGSTVSVHYVGTLEDGTEFDSNTEGDTPFQFTLGGGSVILGWDTGVVGMKVGGTRTLVIPAELAYGASGQGSIPPNATLTFTVELLEVR